MGVQTLERRVETGSLIPSYWLFLGSDHIGDYGNWGRGRGRGGTDDYYCCHPILDSPSLHMIEFMMP